MLGAFDCVLFIALQFIQEETEMIKEFYVRKAALDVLQGTTDMHEVRTHLTKRMVDENSIACVVRGNDADTIYWKNLADGTREAIVNHMKALGLTNFDGWGLRQAVEKLGQFARREKERAEMHANVSGEYHSLAHTVARYVHGPDARAQQWSVASLISAMEKENHGDQRELLKNARDLIAEYYRGENEQWASQFALTQPFLSVIKRLVHELKAENEISEERNVQIEKARGLLADWVVANQTAEELSSDTNRENIIRYDLGTSPAECVRWVLDALAKHADVGVDHEIARLQGQIVAANRTIKVRDERIGVQERTISSLQAVINGKNSALSAAITGMERADKERKDLEDTVALQAKTIGDHEDALAALQDEAVCLKAQKLGTAEVLRDRENELARLREQILDLNKTIVEKNKQNTDLAGVNHDLRMLLEPHLDAFSVGNGSEAYAIGELYKLAHGHKPGVLTGMKLDDVLTNIRRIIQPHSSIMAMEHALSDLQIRNKTLQEHIDARDERIAKLDAEIEIRSKREARQANDLCLLAVGAKGAEILSIDDALSCIRGILLPHRSIGDLVLWRQLKGNNRWIYSPGEVKNFRCVVTPIVPDDETKPVKGSTPNPDVGPSESDTGAAVYDDLPGLPEHDDKVLGIGRVYSEEKMRLFAVSALNQFIDSLVTFVGPKRKL